MKLIKQIIDENTGVSISLLVLLFGFVSWLTVIYSDNLAHGKSIDKLESAQIELSRDVRDILLTTQDTKNKVDFIYEKQKGR